MSARGRSAGRIGLARQRREVVGPWVKRQNYGGSTTARRQTMKSQFRHSVTGASTGLWRP